MDLQPPERRLAGQHARAKSKEIALRGMLLGGLAVTALLIGWLVLDLGPIPLTAVELVVLGALTVGDRRIDRDHGRWLRGAEGEEKVGAILEGLATEGWCVTHDISLGRGNVDHLAIGPGGIFTVETKSHPGRISVDRLDPRMLAQAYAEKKTIEAITGMTVTPLLVFSEAYLVGRVPAQRKGVTVLPARMLGGYLSRRRPLMSADEAALLHGRLATAVGQASAASPARPG